MMEYSTASTGTVRSVPASYYEMADAGEVSQQQSLKFGDTVLLFVREQFGYVYSELSSSAHNYVSVYKVNRNAEKDPNFPNIAYATFKVIAPNKYKAQQHFKAQQHLKHLQAIAMPESKHEFEQELVSAMSNMEIEIKENRIEQMICLGETVLYGFEIQLMHMASKRYISLPTEQTFQTESNNRLVHLSKEDSECCIFKILPRYKVRSRDQVHYGDQIKLESHKTPGQFLHCSSLPLNSIYHVPSHHHKLNQSASETAITLVPHYSRSESDRLKALRGGCCVRLFHCENECYVVAVGSFANDLPILQNVHSHQRQVDQKAHSMPSTSANTYWQIEKEKDSRSGDILLWGERCRIKHLPTRLYLTVLKSTNGKWEVGLKEREFTDTDLDTLFSFHSLLKEADVVESESYARIKHFLSETWLHVDGPYKQQGDVGLEGRQWDSAKLFEEKGDYYDAFILQEVEEHLLDSFNYVAGIVPVLKHYIRSISDHSATVEKEGATVRIALASLCKWLKEVETERESKNRKKLLRNLMVLEQLIEIMKYYGTIINPSTVPSSNYKLICQECYNVLKQYLKGESRKNKNYLARFIEFFMSQVGMGVNAEEVLVEIVQDNLAIVSRIAKTQMDKMINQLIATKDHRFLNFLSSLCVCSGRPIPSTQNSILEKLVFCHGETLFIKTGVDEQGDVFCLTDEKPVKLQHLKKYDHAFEFLEAQLHLFVQLCKGNNSIAIEALSRSDCLDDSTHGYVSLTEVFSFVLSEKEIHPVLKSRYIELIVVMFVAVGRNRSFLDHICYSFDYLNLRADFGVISSSVAREHFRTPKLWIVHTLMDNQKLKCDELDIQHNKFLVHVLNLLCYLVNYSYYDNCKEIDEILNLLINLLDGESDAPGLGRRTSTPANRAVFAVKKKALDVVDMIIRMKCYFHLKKFICDTKPLIEGGKEQQQSEHLPPILKKLWQEATEHTKTCSEGRSHACICDRPEVTKEVREHMQSIFCEKSNGHVPVEKLRGILLDLSCYESDDLIRHSIMLLTDIHFLEDTLFTGAAHSQLLNEVQSVTVQEAIDSTLPELRKLLSINCDTSDQEQLLRILKRLTEYCKLFGDNSEPHKENQLILYNFGIFSDILSFILAKNNQNHAEQAAAAEIACLEEGQSLRMNSLQTQTAQQTPCTSNVSQTKDIPDPIQVKVFRSCFELLHGLALKNEKIQKKLFDRLGELLKIRVAVHNLAELLTEVFAAGPEICLKVREEHVETIFVLTAEHKSTASTQAQLMIALQALVKIDNLNLPVNRNQGLIIKYFCKYRDSFCHDIVGDGDKQRDFRWRMLTSMVDTQGNEFDQEVQLLLSLTDLLASCAEGDNHYIQPAVCQKIYSVEELIRIISSELPPMIKRPFVRYLIYLYMNTQSDRDSHAIAHGEQMWNYLAHVAELLRNLKVVLQEVPAEHKQLFQQGLGTSVRQRTYSFSRFVTQETPTVILRYFPHITGSDRKMLPGFLEYFTQGIVYLLYVYFTIFFDPSNAGDKQENELNVLGEISLALYELGGEIMNFIGSEENIRRFYVTLQRICTHSALKAEHRISLEKLKNLSRKLSPPDRKSCVNSNMACYKRTYDEQVKLNETFHLFVKKYELAYRGPDTAFHQIQSPIMRIPYSDCGEELPLGPGFQELVNCYCSHPKASPKVKPEAKQLLTQLEISVSRERFLSEAEQQEQDLLDIRCLQVLRAIIHNRIKYVDPIMKDRHAARYRKWCVNQLYEVQEGIQKFGNAAKRVLPLLSHPNGAIANEVLLLLKALLFSGNTVVQKGLRDFVNDTRGEILFANLKKILDDAEVHYTERQSLQLQLKQRAELKQGLVKMFGTDFTENHCLAVQMLGCSTMEVKRRMPEHTVIFIEEEDEIEEVVTTERKSFVQSRKITCDETEMKILNKTSPRQAWKSQKEKDQSDENPLNISPDTSTALVLEVIGLMCDGQQRKMQNYLREQLHNFRTINVVAVVAEFLQTYTRDICSDNYKQIREILQALIEMCVGNASNQQVILSKHVVDSINQILQLPSNDEGSKKIEKPVSSFSKPVAEPKPHLVMLLEIKLKAVELLEVMLEDTCSDLESIRRLLRLQYTVNKNNLKETLVYFSRMSTHPDVVLWNMDNNAEHGKFLTYHVLDTLGPYSVNSVGKPTKASKWRSVWNQCHNTLRCVEINSEEDCLKKICFPHNPRDELREEIIKKVKWNIKRDSMEDKQRALLELFDPIKKDLKHQHRLKKNYLTRVMIAFHQPRHRLLNLLTILLCCFVLFVFEVPDNLKIYGIASAYNSTTQRPLIPSQVSPYNWYYKYMLYSLGSVHLFLSLWMVIEYYLINYPHFRLPQLVYSCIKKTVEIMSVGRIRVTIRAVSLLDVNPLGIRSIYVIVFLACSVLSLVWYGYFYCICAFYIVVENDILQRVLRAVTKNGIALLNVLLLGVVFLYLYAVLSFAFLYDRFYKTDDGELFCDTLFQCFVSVIRFGLIDNLGLIIPLDRRGLGSDQRTIFDIAGWRLLLDLSFFILITTIGLNIVFGIIIDSFSELRDERNNIEEDQKSKCFICDLPSHEFDHHDGKGFHLHVKEDHNMWNYIYYSHYLDCINTSDHTAVQKYVYNSIARNSTDFFPKKKTIDPNTHWKKSFIFCI